MQFRHNLTVSFILHAAILTTAVTVVAGRDAVKRIPFTTIYVEFATESSAPPQHISSMQERELFPKTTVTSPLPDSPVASSQHPAPSSQQIETKAASEPSGVEKKIADVVPDEKKADRDQGRGPGFNFIDTGQRSVDLPATSTAGHAETQSSVRSVTGAVEGKGHTNAVAAIRTAIERAKYYPLTAKRRGIEGTVTVEFAVNGDGLPRSINIVTSSGSDILDNAALTTITRAAPFPNGIRTIKVPISFRLEKD